MKLSALSLDRMSTDELLARGYANRVVPPVVERPPEPAPAQEVATLWAPINAEVPGIIYVLQAPPVMAVKIGFTRAMDLIHRVKNLQTGNPYPLLVIASASGLPAQEREAHAALLAERLTGEWFDWTSRVEAFVSRLGDGIESAIEEAVKWRNRT